MSYFPVHENARLNRHLRTSYIKECDHKVLFGYLFNSEPVLLTFIPMQFLPKYFVKKYNIQKIMLRNVTLTIQIIMSYC